MTRPRYRDTRLRLLVDMHIPDWDARFLSRYSPENLERAVAATGAEAVMLYFQSHLGLCYWPTASGTPHAAMGGADWAGEALARLQARGLPVCGYYSVNFNNRAWAEHPDWRLQPAAPASVGHLPRERYGIVCLNNPDYRAFLTAQVAEILAYPVDAMFFDMVWWNGVCICPRCRDRYRAETGATIPETIDWADPAWRRFQAAREGWLAELAVSLRAQVRAARPGLDVYHNFALGLANWTRGISLASVEGHDFLGGDFYGGRAEQLLVTRLMLNLTPAQPPEFMTTVGADLTEHTRLRPAAEFAFAALAAAASGAAFLAIAAIDPDGAIDPAQTARIAASFDAARPFVGQAAGAPIEDIGLYFSDASRMAIEEAPRPLSTAPAASRPDYPHAAALTGWCRILQQAHLPFGVVTRRNLRELARWRVLVLPNVAVLDAEERAAIRAFVDAGGTLYASRHAIAALDDEALLGCRAGDRERGGIVYLQRPGERPLGHRIAADGRQGAVRLEALGGEVLATLTLPYGYPASGSLEGRDFASIHSAPPWIDTQSPMLLRHRFGAGTAIASACDLEAADTPEHDALLLRLIHEALPAPRFRADAPRWVWVTGFAQPDRIVLTLLNAQAELPPLPVASARVTLRLPAGRRCALVTRIGSSIKPSWRPVDGDAIAIDTGALDQVAMLAIDLF